MVNVFIRNVDDKIWREFKQDAKRRGFTLAQELETLIPRFKWKGGRVKDLLKIPTIRLGTEEAKTASQNIDKLASEGAWEDYMRHKRSAP